MYIQKVTTEKELEQTLELRKQVFCEEQGVPEKEEIDVFDDVNHKKSMHLIVTDKGQVVGTLRVVNSTDYAKIGRVAVKADFRGKGIGKKMVNFAIDECLDQNLFNVRNKYFYLESQVEAIPFYEKLGFKAYGEEFDDCGIPHRKMQYLVF
ncbi:GNAT family N-acetyltransferase [Mollicutes bacterium LVI A0078]|nr:GNAT family N-acetyltransferase [Mollicutes bacterium LVI A0075]WOO91531.1 GNAT family N-acetyltransferase [Mollicutes bacterium LVI A0078]